jgi:hypothetical protein
MNYEEEKKWLESLKVGDKVCVSGKYGISIETILKITPTGIIKTKSGDFRNGRHRIDDWRSESIQPATDEIRRKIRILKISSKLYTLIVDKRILDKITDESEMLLIFNIVKKYEATK